MYSETTNEIEVSVQPFYVEERSKPDLSYFFYAYQVQIINRGTVPLQIVERHWIITDGHGHVEEVTGEGVVGLQPLLGPGETFEYTSACPLRTPTGNMRGSYILKDDEGKRTNVAIPLFFLRHPSTFH